MYLTGGCLRVFLKFSNQKICFKNCSKKYLYVYVFLQHTFIQKIHCLLRTIEANMNHLYIKKKLEFTKPKFLFKITFYIYIYIKNNCIHQYIYIHIHSFIPPYINSYQFFLEKYHWIFGNFPIIVV